MSHAVIVSPDPTSSSGGVERMCGLLAGVLEGLGWQVDTVGPGREPARWLYRLGAGPAASSWDATRAARDLRPDLLVTNGFLGVGPSRGPARVHVYHGTMVRDTQSEWSVLPWRERVRRVVGGGLAEALSGRRATVVCVSETAAKEVRRFYGINADAVIPNGVDTAVFHPRARAQARERMGLAQSGRYCLFVGRMQYRKGADLLVDACRQADFQLLIAGAGGAIDAHNLGILAPESLANAYAAADCVLFPTRYEACSYVVLEALACGVPLLTTRVGWMPTLLRELPEYEALCVRPDHDDIVARLRQLAELDTDKLTSSARALVLRDNSLASYAAHWLRLLTELGFVSPASSARDQVAQDLG
jgi:glycosyltransferase involved in cell wall biosynthesis